ncbi:hypothetical protein [Sporosarcina psychrophila]|uniref:t-SNARE coiled-coil homology domain-containing protein n=1 Tax=Sporosarcina psychrophila TaxID=1476 RepID=A0ABV2KBT2_SPOPS
MDQQAPYVTRLELIESQHRLKEDVSKRIDVVDEKVDTLRDLVLPMGESLKQTAENTRKMAESMDRFTEAQRGTNGRIYEKMNGHDVEFARLNVIAGSQTENKKTNAKVLVAVIGGIVTIITGLFALAPYLFN